MIDFWSFRWFFWISLVDLKMHTTTGASERQCCRSLRMRATCQARPPWSIVPLAAFLENKLDRRYLITSIIILDRIIVSTYYQPKVGIETLQDVRSFWSPIWFWAMNDSRTMWERIWSWRGFFLVMVIDLPLLRLKRFSQVSQLTLLPTIDSSGSTRVTL